MTAQPTGSAPLHGRLWSVRARDWADLQEPQHRTEYETLFAAAGLAPGHCHCDVGCGAGTASVMAAGRGARVWGLDAAPGLIEIARSRTPGGDFRVGEMEALPFDEAMFDLVTGFHAFNYATRPEQALAEARRVTKPGGRVVMSTWGRPEGMGLAAMINALNPLLPPPPAGRPGNFALADPSALRALVESAGLTVLRIDHVANTWHYADLDTAVRGFASSGRAVRAAECSGQAAVDAAHARALAPYRRGDGSYGIDCNCIWVLAQP